MHGLFMNEKMSEIHDVNVNDDSTWLISLTTIPRRIHTTLPRAIASIKRSIALSNVRVKIIINVPLQYAKWQEESKHIAMPATIANDPDIIVHRCAQDYGPATKLFGAIDYIDANELKRITHVLTIDDDIEYTDPHFLTFFKNARSVHPNCAIPCASICLLHPPYQAFNGLKYNNVGFVDVPCGYKGVLYPIHMFNPNRFFMSREFIREFPEGIVHDDDAYFGIILSIMRIAVYVVKFEMEYREAIDPAGSAVACGTTKNRIINEGEIYSYAVEKKYLPNANKNDNKTRIHE